MRLIVAINFLLILLFPIHSSSQEIKWISLEDAVYLQEVAPRNIIMDVYTNWCGPCKMLDRNTFSNKSVINYINENFYAVKFNAEGNDVVNFRGYEFINPNYDASKSNRRNSSHQLTRSLGVSAYPTIIFLDKTSNLIHRLRGYQSPKQIEVYLKLFTDENFKQIQTQEDFQKFYNSFEYEFESR